MKRGRLVAGLGLLLLVWLILTYVNHFDNGFYFDDAHTISSNAAITDIRNIPRFFTDASTFSSLPANQAYRPMVTTLNAIDYWIGGGLDPVVFHVSIFASYVVLLILLFFVFRRIFDRALPHRWNGLFALAGAAFYGFHASNAETVNYIISRSDSFSTLCVVAALFTYQIPALRRIHLYLLPLIVGIYAKQTAVMFAPILFVYVFLFETDDLTGRGLNVIALRVRRALVRALPALAVGGGLFLFNQLYLTPTSTVSTNTGVSRLAYLSTQMVVITHYLGNFVLPVELSADPDFQVIASWSDVRVVRGAFVVLGLLAIGVACAFRPRTRPACFGISWFFLALLPTSSIVPLYQLGNDHRTFFPYIGLAFGAVWGTGLLIVANERSFLRRPGLRATAFALAFLVIAGHSLGTFQRNRVWDSSDSLWLDVTRKSPLNGRGLMNYGLSQMEKGHLDVALAYYERALEFLPRYSYLHVNLGICKNALGRKSEAEDHFRQALRYGPDNPEVYYYYARWLDEQGRADEALRLLRSGLEISPGHTRIASLLASVETRVGREVGSRILSLEKEVQRAPTVDGYVELSLAYYQDARYSECIEACRRALELNPGSALAYNNMCSAYNQLAEWDRAIEACEKAVELDPSFERARANLRWARNGHARTP